MLENQPNPPHLAFNRYDLQYKVERRSHTGEYKMVDGLPRYRIVKMFTISSSSALKDNVLNIICFSKVKYGWNFYSHIRYCNVYPLNMKLFSLPFYYS